MTVQDGCEIEFLEDSYIDEDGFIFFQKGTTRSCRYGSMVNDTTARFCFNMQPGDWSVVLYLNTNSFKVL